MSHNLAVPYPTNEEELLQWIDPESWSEPAADWSEISQHLGKYTWHRGVLERLAATREEEIGAILAAWKAENLQPPWLKVVDLSDWSV